MEEKLQEQNSELQQRIRFLHKHYCSMTKISSICRISVEEVEQRLNNMGLLRSKDKTVTETRKSGNRVQILKDGKWIFEHRLIWEQANGTIPDNRVIYQLNNMESDNRIENLIALPKGDKEGLSQARIKRILDLETKSGVIHPSVLDKLGNIPKKVNDYLKSKKKSSRWWTDIEREQYEYRPSSIAKEIYKLFLKKNTQTIDSISKEIFFSSKVWAKKGLAELIAEKVIRTEDQTFILQENEAHPKYIERLKEKHAYN